MFASFEEDKALQKDKWASRYNAMRPVMWDMTGISAYAFSSADLQRFQENDLVVIDGERRVVRFLNIIYIKGQVSVLPIGFRRTCPQYLPPPTYMGAT
eukprot:scaffold22569_cov146-Skeletonema_dohrnii-CCMP3373.AAC.1